MAHHLRRSWPWIDEAQTTILTLNDGEPFIRKIKAVRHSVDDSILS